MMTAPYIAVFLLFVGLYALAEARHDFNKIQADKGIDHLERWVVRAGVVTLVAAVFVLPIRWKALLLLPIGAFGFSAAFRWCLNRMRECHSCYVSPSSWYDYLFLVWTGVWTWIPAGFDWSNWRSFMRHAHLNNYELNDQYVQQVHRAGRLAYLTEITIVVAAIAVALFTNN